MYHLSLMREVLNLISNLIKDLNDYWEVENRVKHDMHRVDDEYYLSPKKSNWIVMVIVISLFTITACFVGAGML